MMKLFSTLNYLFGVLHFAACIDYDGWLNIKMLHSVNCGSQDSCHRGNIILKSIRAGNSVIDQIQFNKEHIAELTALAEIDGFYSIKTIVTSAENKESEFLSSVKAQAFLDNGLSDVINAWVLPNGAIIAVSFQVANHTQPVQIVNHDAYEMNSNFYLHYVDQAPVPDTASYIQKIEREREAREKGELKDNRSFLAKYVILPTQPSTLELRQCSSPSHAAEQPCCSSAKPDLPKDERSQPEKEVPRILNTKFGHIIAGNLPPAHEWMYIVPIAIFVMISGSANPEPAAQATR